MPDGSHVSTSQVTEFTALGDMSLGWAMVLIEQDTALPASQTSQWLSALRRLARYLDKDPAHLPTRMTALRIGVAKLHHVPLGISKKNLQNLKANVKAALRHVGALEVANLRKIALTAPWQDLHNRLDPHSMKRLRRGLSAFMRYCSQGGIHPPGVTNQAVADFVQALTESSFVEKPNDRHRNVCRFWNAAAEQVPGWPAITLEVPSFRAARRSLPETHFPASFQADIEASTHSAGFRPASSGVILWSASKHFQRALAESLLVCASVLTGHKPGSAIRPRLDGTSFHASIIACRLPASLV